MKHTYKTSLKWQEGKKGIISTQGKPDIAVAAPPEFKGPLGFLSPEDLLVSAVNSCLMLTFLFYAQREGLELQSYESEATGILEMSEGKMMVSTIAIAPKVSFKSPLASEKLAALFK